MKCFFLDNHFQTQSNFYVSFKKSCKRYNDITVTPIINIQLFENLV